MRLVLIVTIIISIAGSARADDSLSVLVREIPPFIMKNNDGSWSGLSVALWEEIADSLGLPFRYEELPFDDVMSRLERDSQAVAISPFTMTSEREQQIDFLHPFYSSGLGIAVRSDEAGGWWHVIRGLFSWTVVQFVLVWLVVLSGIGFAVWIVERRRNPEQFGGSPLRGIASGVWWSVVTMTTVGYGDKAPVTVVGRILATIWMFAGLIAVASLTASITTFLTVARLQSGIESLDDLRNRTVVSVDGSTSSTLLTANRIRHRSVDDPKAAVDAVHQNDADAVVYDAPILQHLVAERDGLTVLPWRFQRQVYAFAVPPGSPLREEANRALLSFVESGDYRTLVEEYLGLDNAWSE